MRRSWPEPLSHRRSGGLIAAGVGLGGEVADRDLGEGGAPGVLGVGHRLGDAAGAGAGFRRGAEGSVLADLRATEGGRVAFDGEDDVEHREFGWWAVQDVAADPALGRLDEAGAGEGLEALGEVRAGDPVELGEPLGRDGGVGLTEHHATVDRPLDSCAHLLHTRTILG
jgi:hypothetical protein